MMTLDQISQKHGIKHDTLWKRAKRARIEAQRVGTIGLYTPAQVRKLIKPPPRGNPALRKAQR